MEIFIENQLIILLYSSFLGLIFGAGYDIIRIVHQMLGKLCFRAPVIFLLDLAYMLALTGCVSLFAYRFNHGDIRLFFILPMGVGFALYICTVGRLVMAISDRIIRFIRSVIRYAVILPLCWIGGRCIRLFRWVLRHTVIPLKQWIAVLRRRRYTIKQKKRIGTWIRLPIEK